MAPQANNVIGLKVPFADPFSINLKAMNRSALTLVHPQETLPVRRRGREHSQGEGLACQEVSLAYQAEASLHNRVLLLAGLPETQDPYHTDSEPEEEEAAAEEALRNPIHFDRGAREVGFDEEEKLGQPAFSLHPD
jgi:hypothetical protein